MTASGVRNSDLISDQAIQAGNGFLNFPDHRIAQLAWSMLGAGEIAGCACDDSERCSQFRSDFRPGDSSGQWLLEFPRSSHRTARLVHAWRWRDCWLRL